MYMLKCLAGSSCDRLTNSAGCAAPSSKAEALNPTPHNHTSSGGNEPLPPIPVRILALDTLSFHAPLEIGSMLSLTARVDYSEIMGMESEILC
ncbi:hypothetical protein CF319_g4220 [Tilletia indica]|nr:hypothetical protein CF319_g4220 [Tilletia indica]